jgi:hypothetical protein
MLSTTSTVDLLLQRPLDLPHGRVQVVRGGHLVIGHELQAEGVHHGCSVWVFLDRDKRCPIHLLRAD